MLIIYVVHREQVITGNNIYKYIITVIKLVVTPQVQVIIREHIVKILYTLVVFNYYLILYCKQQHYTVLTYF
jgi:hypothetical protein